MIIKMCGLFLLCILFLSANHISFSIGQYIATNGEPNVNRPLMRWEQFQRQLRLNQLQPPPPPSSNNFFTNPPSANSVLLLPPPPSPSTSSFFPPTLFTPASLFPPPSNNQPVTVSPIQWTRPIELISSQQASRSPSWSSNDHRSPGQHAAVDSSQFHNQTGSASSSSSSSSIPNAQWKANMIHLSRRLTNLTLTFTDNQFAAFLRLVHELSGSISTDCLSSTISLFYGIRRQQQWAIQMLDAGGFPPHGLVDGTFSSLGEYDQCLSINIPNELVKRDRRQHPSMVGAYCLLQLGLTSQPSWSTTNWTTTAVRNHSDFRFSINQLNPNWNTSTVNLTGNGLGNTWFERVANLGIDFLPNLGGLRMGVCVPSTCSTLDVHILLNRILNPYRVYVQDTTGCDTRMLAQSSLRTPHSRQVYYSLAAITLLLFLGSFVDYVRRTRSRCGVYPQDGLLSKLLRCWSVAQALRTLRQCNCQLSAELYVLHGLRAIFMFWLVWANCYFYGAFYGTLWAYKRLHTVEQVPRKFWFQFVTNSLLIADCNYFISGLLLMYIGLPTLNASRGRTQLFWQVARRSARILAALIGLACAYLVTMSHISGPLLLDSTVRRLLIQNCEVNWWTNFAFLLNWQPLSEMCLPHTWFLSTQMQLLLITLIILLVFGHKQKLTINFFLLILIACGFISCLTNLHFELPPTLTGHHFVNQRNVEHFLYLTYFPTYQHAPAFIIGIITASLLLNRPSMIKNANKGALSFIWLLLISIAFLIFFMPFLWANVYLPSQMQSALYAALHRPLFVLLIAYISFTSISGSAGWFGQFLCSPRFVPFSRLSLSIFIIHPLVIIAQHFTRTTSINFSNTQFALDALTTYMLSLFAALLLYVFFVCPLDSLCKLLANSCGGGGVGGAMCARTFTSKLGASSLLSEWSGRNCHCGQSAARLAAKVHIDFSTFGLNSTNGKTVPKKFNNNTDFTGSSSELLSGHHLNHHLLNYNNHSNSELLDQALVNQLTTSNMSADDQHSSSTYITNLNNGGNGENALNAFLEHDSTHMRPLLVSGIHNQLGQNVAADIRKRLEQIKTNAMRKSINQEQDMQNDLDNTTTAQLANLNELSVDDDVDVLGAYAHNPANSFNGFTFKV